MKKNINSKWKKSNKLKQTMKEQNIKGKLLSNQIATHNMKEKKKLGRLRLHENWTRTFVLRFFMCFSRHIAVVCRALKPSFLKNRNLHLNLRLQKLPYCCTKRTPWLMSSECNVNVECIFIDQTSFLLSIFAFQRQVSNVFFSHDHAVLVLQINGMRLTKTSEDVYRMYNE